MKHRIKTAAIVIICVAGTITVIGRSRLTVASMPADDVKAISLVKAALALTRTAARKTARIHAEGKWFWSNEGLSPQQPSRALRLSADWEVDFQNRRFLQRSAGYLGKELLWCTQVVAAQEIRYSLFCHSNVFSSAGPDKMKDTWTYWMDTTYPDPEWQLTHALEQSHSLRWEGQTMDRDQHDDVISYTDEFRRRHLLFLNSRTHLLREASTDARITRLGDGFVPRIIFQDYRRIGSVWRPQKINIVQNSFVMMTNDLQSITSEFNRPSSYSRFAPPPNAREVNQKDLEFHVSQVAKSVYFVENASPDYNCMFVVFADYVLVVEAPLSDSVSAKVMAAIHETAPGKPIRYVVATHFHEDHIGGLRAYLRAGAALVTTPGNLQFMDLFARKLKTTEPNVNLSPVEVVADRRQFTDGEVTVDLFSVASPHADEMLVPVIASDGVVYVADGFTRDWGPWRPLTVEERVLARQFKNLGLKIRLLLLGHGPATTQVDLERYLSSTLTPPRTRSSLSSNRLK
jgi:glyoxylase-like metal-dependent hydrolase (beta-lactamase superfamily II)